MIILVLSMSIFTQTLRGLSLGLNTFEFMGTLKCDYSVAKLQLQLCFIPDIIYNMYLLGSIYYIQLLVSYIYICLSLNLKLVFTSKHSSAGNMKSASIIHGKNKQIGT